MKNKIINTTTSNIQKPTIQKDPVERLKKERIPWEEYFMTQALLIATRSTCPRLSVGCIITQENRVISTGYNGSVSGLPHCSDTGCKEVDGHCIRTVHAEVNAVTQCARLTVSTSGATAYVTHYPCLACAKTLIQAGVRHIRYAFNYKNSPHVDELLEELGVTVKQVHVKPDALLNIVDKLLTLQE